MNENPIDERLPSGVRLIPLLVHTDSRGSFSEIYRENWPTGVQPVQWNLVHSRAGTLRGVHVHHKHDDYLLMARGRMILGLHDLRRDSPDFGRGFTLELSAESLAAAVIPIGVAHGFYFAEESTHVYAVTEYWNPGDELGCVWNDRSLEIDWPAEQPHVSERDQELPDRDGLLEELEPLQTSLWPPREAT